VTHSTQFLNLNAALSEPFFCSASTTFDLLPRSAHPDLLTLPLLIDDCCHCLDDQLAPILWLLYSRLDNRSHPDDASFLNDLFF